jgi:hypothetical protein
MGGHEGTRRKAFTAKDAKNAKEEQGNNGVAAKQRESPVKDHAIGNE